MSRHKHLTNAATCVFVLSVMTIAPLRTMAAPTQDVASGPAAAAAKASPDLISALSEELGATPEQAAGAAGALFGVAKARMSPTNFTEVANAVPGMDLLLKAAPVPTGPVGTTGTIPQVGGAAAGLAGASSAFSQLGLKPDMVAKAVPVLTSFVSQSGGQNVGDLLADALK